MAKEKKTKEQMPDKNGHLKPTKQDLKEGSAPRGRNRGRHR